MKRNLVKILAMSSLLLTLGACGGKGEKPQPEPPAPDPTEEVVEVTLGQLTNLVDSKWEYEGKTVKLKDLAAYGAYDGGKGLTLGAPYSEGGSDRSGGVEVELKEAYNFKHKTKGLGAKVSVQGKVADQNGHVVLKDAEIVSMSERDYTSGSRDPNTGADMTIWSFNDPQRDGFNNSGRTDSGKNFNFTGLQLLSEVPSYDGSAEIDFYVNFPGENPFVDDEYNLDVIRVSVPKGQPSEFNKPFNDFFGALEVGDQFDMYGNLFYNDGMELRVATQWFNWQATEDPCFVFPTTAPVEFIDDYKDAIEPFDGKYTVDMPALGGDQLVYRYDVTDLWASKIEDISGADLSFVSEALKEEGGLVVVDMMTTYAHAPEMLDTIGGKLATAGYSKISQTAAEAIYRLESTEVDADVALRVAQDEEFHYALEMLFVGRRSKTEEDFTSFAEARADYQAQVRLAIEDDEFTSALPELPAAPASTATKLSWLDLTSYKGALGYVFVPEFAAGAFADDAAYRAYVDAYRTSLLAAGFKANYVVTDFSPAFVGKEIEEELVMWDEANSYFNETTGEFVYVEFLTNIDDEINGIKIHSLIALADNVVFDMNEDSVWDSFEAMVYIDAMFDYAFDGGHTAPQQLATTVYAIQAKYVFKPASGDPKDLAQSFANIVAPSCATQVTQQTASGKLYTFWTLPGSSTDPAMLRLDVAEYPHGDEMYYSIVAYTGLYSDFFEA